MRAGHLELVTPGWTPTEAMRRQTVEMECGATLWCSDDNTGTPLPHGGFELVCSLAREHAGYCRDVTEIAFNPDRWKFRALGGEKMKFPGRVVHWNGLTSSEIREIEEWLVG